MMERNDWKGQWETLPFEQCITKVKYPSKIQSKDYLKSGNYPVISQEKDYISGYSNQSDLVFKVDVPVVIFGDHTRIIKYVDFDFVLGADGVKILRPIDKLMAKFLAYYLQNIPMPNLGYSRHYKLLKEIRVPVPPLPVQARIVDELDCLQGILSKKRQQLAEYHSLAQAIFHQMFGDPVVNEKGWEVKRLGEVFDVFSGGTPSTKQNSYWENGIIPWIGSNMCRNEIIKEGDGKFITQEGLNNSSAKIFSSGYVLVALVGATIGKTALLKFDTSTNQNVAGINVPQNKNYTSEFIFCLLQNLYCLFENISKGKFKMANLTFVRNLPIIAPPIPLQQSFANRIISINNQCESLNKSIHEMETLLATRMDKLLNMDC